MGFNVNINEFVGVKLTDKGIQRMREKHEEHNRFLGVNESFTLKQDEDGYTLFQLWDLMRTFSDLLLIGKEMPFEATLRFPRAKSN